MVDVVKCLGQVYRIEVSSVTCFDILFLHYLLLLLPTLLWLVSCCQYQCSRFSGNTLSETTYCVSRGISNPTVCCIHNASRRFTFPSRLESRTHVYTTGRRKLNGSQLHFRRFHTRIRRTQSGVCTPALHSKRPQKLPRYPAEFPDAILQIPPAETIPVPFSCCT